MSQCAAARAPSWALSCLQHAQTQLHSLSVQVKSLFKSLGIKHKVIELDQTGALPTVFWRSTLTASQRRSPPCFGPLSCLSYATEPSSRSTRRPAQGPALQLDCSSHPLRKATSLQSSKRQACRLNQHSSPVFAAADGEDVQDALVGVSGSHTVPQVFIGGKFVGGADGEPSFGFPTASEHTHSRTGVDLKGVGGERILLPCLHLLGALSCCRGVSVKGHSPGLFLFIAAQTHSATTSLASWRSC